MSKSESVSNTHSSPLYMEKCPIGICKSFTSVTLLPGTCYQISPSLKQIHDEILNPSWRTLVYFYQILMYSMAWWWDR